MGIDTFCQICELINMCMCVIHVYHACCQICLLKLLYGIQKFHAAMSLRYLMKKYGAFILLHYNLYVYFVRLEIKFLS